MVPTIYNNQLVGTFELIGIALLFRNFVTTQVSKNRLNYQYYLNAVRN